MNDRDIDAEFDAIVAHWDDDTSTPPKPRTVQDITAAYAALSRQETDPAPPPDDPAQDVVPGAETGSDGVAEAASASAAVEPAGDAGDAGEATVPAVEQPPEQEAWRQGPSIHDEDDHFEPPPVQLPPGEDIGYWGALVGLIGGPLLLLWVVLTTPFYGGWWTLGAILMFFGGFALLVLRQPRNRDPFDNDDGARV